ncbi:DUF1993 family protein [Bradyrhizobium liaoningense]|uniref:DUF1993 domain-containing protein n=1 Tax=Bradyrhizobium liaoningense TaxID=43992 RepID=UPI001BA6E251|nr:DUF1993 family protein [Bradyrhizobium liaoningense]MBR0821104.1 DUF1993 family protein [Bradyrhizobium liaoningense]
MTIRFDLSGPVDVHSANEPMEFGVSFSIYEITVPVMVHGLNVMDDYLDHAQALERTKGVEPGRILRERLVPDMLTFGEQFSVNCNKVDAHMAKLMQRDVPAPRNTSMMYPALKRRILETRSFLQNVQPDEISGARSHTYELTPPIVRGWFGGDDYIRHLVLPDFFFHISIAHAILRHLGAKIGKRDYLGNLSQQSGGDYS